MARERSLERSGAVEPREREPAPWMRGAGGFVPMLDEAKRASAAASSPGARNSKEALYDAAARWCQSPAKNDMVMGRVRMPAGQVARELTTDGRDREMAEEEKVYHILGTGAYFGKYKGLSMWHSYGVGGGVVAGLTMEEARWVTHKFPFSGGNALGISTHACPYGTKWKAKPVEADYQQAGRNLWEAAMHVKPRELEKDSHKGEYETALAEYMGVAYDEATMGPRAVKECRVPLGAFEGVVVRTRARSSLRRSR
jgi:hypothetical protein